MNISILGPGARASSHATMATVLVVDDTDAQRYTTSYALRKAGFEVIEVATGQDALAMAEQQPDLILLDIVLPDLDGMEVCRRLKANPVTSEIPVIHLSAHRVESQHRIEGLKCGADDYIAQPVLPDELAAKVKAWARVRRAEAELRRKNGELERANQELGRQLRSLQETEEALAAAHRRTQRVLSSITEGYYRLNREWRFAEVNARAEQHFRRSWPELSGKCIWELPELPSQNVYRQNFEVALTTGESMSFEAESYVSPGRWSELHAYPTQDGVEVYFRDITERKRTEQALAQSEARLRRFYESGIVGAFYWKADGSITEANDNFLQITGYSREELNAGTLNWVRMSPVEYRQRDQTYIAEVKATGIHRPRELEYIRKDGSRVPLIVGAASLDEAAHEGIAFVVDITARKRAGQELRRSEARFRATVENIPQAVWVADGRANFQYLSPKWLEYTGTTEDENANGGWIAAIHPEDRSKALQRWQTAVAGRSAYEAEYRLRRWDGEYRWHVGRAVPMAESESEEPLWFGTTADIDDRKRTQELLIRSEKVAALGRMAATLAHDINNPLAAAMNALYLAQSNMRPESLKEYLDIADAELRRISHITRQALGFYRESTQPGVVDLESTLDEALSLFKSKIRAKHICIQKEQDSSLKVRGISGELRQVFSNLIANSVDAVPENGSIKVRLSHLTNPNTTSRYVRVSVADNGAGIDANLVPHIFEPLFTTKGAIGTGLGLWVSKQLVEKHGGSIRVRSCTGSERQGTTFTVLLPADLPAELALVS